MINRSRCGDHPRICSEWPKRRFVTAPVMRDLNTRNMEISDDYAKHRINCSESRQRRTRPEIRAGQRTAVCLPRTGERASCHVHAWLSRQRLDVSEATASLRGCGISRGLAVLAWLRADRDSTGRCTFRSRYAGQGSRSAHRGVERRRTGMCRWHGLGRHVDLSGAGHGAIGDQGRRGHEHRAPDRNREIQAESRSHSIHLPCVFFPDAWR